MFENAPKHKGLTNPIKNGEKAKKVWQQHKKLLEKMGAKPINSPLK